ncbi:mucin-3B-like [Myiozetetes cayanensis]|uniref:mucin-3B-like n=1 Tax=Myiozetetes cayanensis TaxID=478635 RepID=UPI002160D066|nr:mucin-3B-like [Myiozetetes cayanensis]
MDRVYKDIEGYQGIEVQELLNGSVLVRHTIIVALLVTTQSQEKLHNITVNVQEKIKEGVTQFNCTDDILCFDSSQVTVSEGQLQFDKEAYCQSQAPQGYQEFFFPNLTSSGVSCMSNCTPGTASTIDCHRGRCQLTRTGPQCFCEDTNLYWYQDSRCRSRVSKLGVGLGVAVAVLAVTVVVLAVLLALARRSRRSQG